MNINKLKHHSSEVKLDDITDLLPEKYYIWLQLEEENLSRLVLITSYYQDEPVGYAIYSTNNAFKNQFKLNYIYVKREYRRQFVASKMLQATARYIKTSKDVKITVLLDEIDYIYSGLFKKTKYQKLENIYFIRYLKENILDSPLIKDYQQLSKITSHISTLEEIRSNAAYWDEYITFLENNNICIDFDKLDDQYTKFYLNDTRVLGAIIAQLHGKNQLVIPKLYYVNGISGRLSIPTIFTSILYQAAKSLPDDSNIFIFLDNEQFYNAMEPAFGEYEEYEEYEQWEL